MLRLGSFFLAGDPVATLTLESVVTLPVLEKSTVVEQDSSRRRVEEASSPRNPLAWSMVDEAEDKFEGACLSSSAWSLSNLSHCSSNIFQDSGNPALVVAECGKNRRS